MLKKIMEFNAILVTGKPKIVLAAALLITLLCGILASDLQLELNWVALAPADEPSVKEYERIMEDFPSLTNIIVVIESDDSEKLAEAADRVGKVMKENPWVSSTVGRIPRDFLIDYGLLLADKNQIEEAGFLFADPSLDGFYSNTLLMMNELKAQENDSSVELNETVNSLEKFFTEMNRVLKTGDTGTIPEALSPLFSGSGLITSEDGRMTVVTVQPSFGMMDMVNLTPGVNSIEATLKQLDSEMPDVSIRATGMHIVARDETASIESDSKLTMILSVIFILLLLYFAFRSFLAPVLAFVPLLLGIIWTIGFTRLTVGRLNMMTAFSAAMLLGLGIDYAIHLYSSYTEGRSRNLTKTEAIRNAMLTTGPSIIIGAVTTALAFLSLNISSLAVLSELGTVMATGIIATLVSVFWVLPALIVLKKEKDNFSEKISGSYGFIGSIAAGCRRGRFVIIPLLAAASVFMFFQARHTQFDMNLMNIEPEGLESIALMNYMVDKYDLSSDSFSFEADSLEDVYRYKKAFEELPHTAKVSSIADVLPQKAEQQARLRVIEDVRKSVEAYRRPAVPFDEGSALSALSGLEQSLEALDRDGSSVSVQKLAELVKVNRKLLTTAAPERLEGVSEAFRNEYVKLSDRMLSPEVLTVDSLPAEFKSQFVGAGADKYLVNIYPDFDIWSNLDTETGESFLDGLAAINPSVTGTPVFMKALYDQASSDLKITVAVLFVILFAVVVIYFRSFRYALLVFVPLGFSLVFMLGIMSLADLKFNMLNFLSVLLVIGIGLDDGIHIVHHYLYDSESRSIKLLFSKVGRAILLTTLTTLIGFGSLAFSSYRGIASLGIALVIGVGLTFIMTVLIIPAFLRDRD